MIIIKLKNSKEICGALKAYPNISAKHFQKAIKRSLIKIQRRAMQKAPVDTGALRARWNLQLGFLKGSLSPKSKYAGAVEYGTKPHWVSAKRLEGWARRHGVSPFAVQRSIARKGTRAQPFFEPAVKEREVNKEFESALIRILDEI